MFWVGVRYRGIALPDIMKVMRLWLDQRKYQPKAFDYVISGTGTLVRMEFEQEAEAGAFAEAFAGRVSRDRPTMEGNDGNSAERPSHADGDGRPIADIDLHNVTAEDGDAADTNPERVDQHPAD